MAFLYFSISINIHISIDIDIFIFNYIQLFKGIGKFFPSVKDCHLVRPHVSIHSLPGSPFEPVEIY